MNESNNPFELMQESQTASAPGTDPFGMFTESATTAEAQPVASPIDLGSQPDTPNPLDNLTTPPAAPAEPAVPAAPVSFEPPPAAPNADAGGAQMSLTPETPAAAEAPSEEADNPIAAAMEQQTNAGIFAKPPIFEHGAVKEPIEDTDQTFDELRAAKADDFPELEEAVSVSWEVIYGRIRKTVPTPKKTKIGEFKRTIESSKEFLDALKKDKNKSPDCIVKPKIAAKSKGERMPLYKGIFTSREDAENSGKVISIFPARDGRVYEMRKEESGTYITQRSVCRELSEVKAGFTPALPLIPNLLLCQIISFFRSFMSDGENYEALAFILWDRQEDRFCTFIPRQTVSAVRADVDLLQNEGYDTERYLHYMDIHSHNVMSAKFSHRDDRDEKATGLYTVIGRLDRYLPEISVRLSNGGTYLPIDPAIVFEAFGDRFPLDWREQVSTVEAHRNSYLPPHHNKGYYSALAAEFGQRERVPA